MYVSSIDFGTIKLFLSLYSIVCKLLVAPNTESNKTSRSNPMTIGHSFLLRYGIQIAMIGAVDLITAGSRMSQTKTKHQPQWIKSKASTPT